ncbi:Kiwa anti-phage protein KwaB-like domain-containing protein [Paenibacillus sp. MMS18-CY102]|uniref:Kiwa anti-phage protein KwaB-like domain-containing protein n=1 Tax=Paenibacillus sp. MMS18-CY102 TaxID=2682849 RepID=UPI0013664549|nr:DUF4868 domain-containing protein [Paenibacillus sp. MMS18-CY102]
MATIGDLTQLRMNISTASIKQAQLLFISKDKRREEPYYVNRAECTPQVATAFISLFEYHLGKLVESDPMFVTYDINLDTEECFQFIPTADVANATRVNSFIIDAINTQPIRSMDEEFFKHLWAYAVKIQFDDQFVIFYRKYTNGKVLKSGTFDALLFQAGRFSQIESTVFQIDNNIDTFCLGQELIILQNTNFERIFGFDDHYEASSGAALQQIAAAHDFVDINLLTEYVGTDSRKKRKLAAISKNQLIANLGFEQIKETIQNYSLEISIDDQNRKFELTRDNAFVFLKALNDDYLRSEATSTRYEASSKRKRR